LRQQVRRSHYRTRDKLWEQQNVQRDIHETSRRHNFAPIDVDHVAQGVKGEEADAHRQHDIEDARLYAERPSKGVDEEVVVLEEPK
jgi:hypothetical protein